MTCESRVAALPVALIARKRRESRIHCYSVAPSPRPPEFISYVSFGAKRSGAAGIEDPLFLVSSLVPAARVHLVRSALNARTWLQSRAHFS